MVGESLKDRLAESEYSTDFWQSFSQRLQYVEADALDSSKWQGLKDALERL